MLMRLSFGKNVLRLSDSSLRTKSLFTFSSSNHVVPLAYRTLTSVASKSQPLEVTTEKQDPPEIEYIFTPTERKGSFLKKATVKDFLTIQDHIVEDKSFRNFSLDSILLSRLESSGFRAATPIQSRAIPEILSGKSCALQSYTGSGKTLAYLLPLLSVAIERAREEWFDKSIPLGEKGQIQAIIVAPSQELAMQIVRTAEMLLPDDSKKAVQQLIGGANIRRQIEGLKTKPLIGVGTPGRLAEHSRKGTLQTHKCPIIVLDEVDQLVKTQFREDMLRVTENTGKKADNRQIILVSATLSPSFIETLGFWAPNTEFVFIGSKAAMQGTDENIEAKKTVMPTWGWGNKWNQDLSHERNTLAKHASISMPPNLRHGFVVVEGRKKVDSLRRAIHAMNSAKCLIFMNYAKRTQDALYKLSTRGMPVGTLHGAKSKLERSQILAQFRNGRIRALIVSEVAARGLDIIDCDAVFNLELPTDPAHYVHRAGRTGRMGRVGWVVSFVEKREVFIIEKLSRRLKIEIPQVEIRNGEVSLINTK